MAPLLVFAVKPATSPQLGQPPGFSPEEGWVSGGGIRLATLHLCACLLRAPKRWAQIPGILIRIGSTRTCHCLGELAS